MKLTNVRIALISVSRSGCKTLMSYWISLIATDIAAVTTNDNDYKYARE